MEQKKLLVILGPTASGKTLRAVQAAKHLDGEIISADSRQVYKYMDLGTGKDIVDYDDIPYHLIDIVPPGSKYNLYQYLRDYRISFDDISSRGKLPILCGGTGLYIESVLNNLSLPEVPQNPELRNSLKSLSLDELTAILSKMKSLHNTTDVDTAQRAIRAIEIETFYENNPHLAIDTTPHPINYAKVIGIDIPREVRRSKISARLDARLDAGMVDEVHNLIDAGVAPENLIYYGLEYKYLTLYVIGQLSYKEMKRQLEIAIHQFSKRQMTWFRGMERRGFKIHWLRYDMTEEEFISCVENLCVSDY